MAAYNWQKMKMFKLAELLQQETDDQHPLKTAEICSRLEAMGIPCDRRTLATDIDLLNEEGMQVQWKWIGKSKAFYIENQNLSVQELGMLIDAVQAADFISEEQTAELDEKLAVLGGTHRSAILKSNLVHFNTKKRKYKDTCTSKNVHNNVDAYKNLNELKKAIQARKKIIFKYFDLGIDGEKVYRQDGHYYVVEPVTLVYNEDKFYLIAYCEQSEEEQDNQRIDEEQDAHSCDGEQKDHSAENASDQPTQDASSSSSVQDSQPSSFRVDRMDGIEVLDEKISKATMNVKRVVSRYSDRAIQMCAGKTETVELEFDKEKIGAVYDRFGDEIEMTVVNDDKVRISVDTQINPSFWGWLFQFGSKMKIISPESAKKEYKKRLTDLAADC